MNLRLLRNLLQQVMIKIKRIYENESDDDGYRILVDRIWPRGVSKERSKIDLWLKEIAPSTSLRKWFSHDPKKWNAFRNKYALELKSSKEVDEVIQLLKRNRVVTLVYSAKDEDHNQAIVLRDFLAANGR